MADDLDAMNEPAHSPRRSDGEDRAPVDEPRRTDGRPGDHQPSAPEPPAWRALLGYARPYRLRTRMDLELEQLAGGELFSQAEMLVAQPVAARLALASFFGQLGPWPRPLIEPTDPDRVRLALARMGEQLPRRARARLGRLLAAADVLEPWLDQSEYSHMAGHVQAPWLAKATLVRQVCGRRARRWLWMRLEAYRDANAAGPWWPSGDVVVVAERPRVVQTEPVALQQGPGRRLHAEDGPAVVWNDPSLLALLVILAVIPQATTQPNQTALTRNVAQPDLARSN